MTDRSQSYTLTDSKVFIEEELRLRLQAEKLFQFEKDSLIKHGLKDGIKVLDLGCGNGFFLSQIVRSFPSCEFYGADRNSKLLQRAQEFCSRAEFTVLDLGDVEAVKKLVSTISPDFIYLRYVLQHMSACEASRLLSALAETASCVLVMDGDDREIKHSPDNDSLRFLIEKKMNRQASLGGDRTVGSRLSTMMNDAGFYNTFGTKVCFSSDNLGWDSYREILWPILRSGLPQEPSETDVAHLKVGEEWYTNASQKPDTRASFESYHVSGRGRCA